MPGKKAKVDTLRAEQAAIIRAVGARLKEARELCNMSQCVAAKRLGYANPSKLSKIESATDTNSIPLWLIIRAAKLYEVSIDFLFGSSDDWEINPKPTHERAVSVWMFETWEKTRVRDLGVLQKLHNKVSAIDEAIAVLVAANDDVKAALERFAELNPEFEDMRAGSRLVGAVNRATDAANGAKAKMQRFRIECSVAAPDTHQLSLTI